MNYKIKNIFFISLIFFLIPLFAFNNALAIGQISKPIEIENALRGQQTGENLKFLNTEDEEKIFLISSEGQIKGWVTFYEIGDIQLENPINEIKMPANAYNDARVKIVVPQDTPNGQYIGQIFVSEKREGEDPKENQAAVSRKVGREVIINVTGEEVINLEASIIPEKFDIKNGDLLKIKPIYSNLSNIAITPNFKLTIIHGVDTVFNAIFPYPGNMETIKPGDRKEITPIEWSTGGQKNGAYRAEIEISYRNEVYEEHEFSFQIVDPEKVAGASDTGGSFLSKLMGAIAFLGGGSLLTGWFIIAGILLAIGVVLIILNRRKSTFRRDF